MSRFVTELTELEQKQIMVSRLPFNQTKISQRLGVSPSHFSRWLNGQRRSQILESKLHRLYQKYHKQN